MHKRSDGSLSYSPSDLVRYWRSPFAAWMDRFHLERGGVEPDAETKSERLIMDLGLRHEAQWLAKCRSEGAVADLAKEDDARKFDRTREEMRKGTPVIYQAALQRGPFGGYADFLHRVEGASNLGSFHYEVSDTKLARSLKLDYAIQLCAYAEMLEDVQGRRPENLHIVLGTKEQAKLRTEEVFWAYLAIKQGFLHLMAEFDADLRPAPDPQDDHGRWSSHVETWIEEHDHLAQVANISRSQVEKLETAGILTMTALGRAGEELKVTKLAPPQLMKLRAQARLQVASRKLDTPAHELIAVDPDEPRRGLGVLPPSSPGDAWIDFEGYPLDETLYYLFGATTVEGGKPCFRDWWGHDAVQEKKAFEDFVDFIHGRWKSDPRMHLYHYAPYEVTALRTLMQRHGTREDEVDDLLRAEVFVDLLPIVRQGVRVGTSSYSLKDVERLYRGGRQGEVVTANESITAYHEYRETRDEKRIDQIRDYNEDDCDSTRLLVEWLRARQSEAGITWIAPARHESKKSEKPDSAPEADQLSKALAAELAKPIPPDRESWGAETERWTIQELLSQLLEFHRREQKPMFWARFDRARMSHDRLVEDASCLGQMTLESPESERLGGKRGLSRGWWYRFDPDQDTKLDAGKGCFLSHDLAIKTTIEKMDRLNGRVQLKFGPGAIKLLPDGVPPRLLSVIPDEFVTQDALKTAIREIALVWRDEGSLPDALRHLLLRRAPRLSLLPAGRPLLEPGEDPTEGATRIAPLLDGTTLCIQGPPGTGKTHTAAEMIRALVKKGYRVGVTANSHPAILNLLRKTCQLAGGGIACVKVGEEPEAGHEEYPGLSWKSPDEAAAMTGCKLVGGTAWFFARAEVAGTFDYLFVDEAGQFSLANAVAAGRSARNLVLIGDQLQLGQPIQGGHPGESGRSVLEYLLGKQSTVKADFGIFLEKTRRLHPKICRFISEAIYEGRLQPMPDTERRVVRVPPGARTIVRIDAGLLCVPVEHDGNVQASDEEVATIAQLFAELIGRQRVDETGAVRKVSMDDILVVAPYNMQVRRLKAKLPGAHVGSVDLFQGQQKPIVIVSMCASDGDSSPRGIEFLFNKNRLNVAISRAESLAIVVGSPALTRTRCGTVAQMRLVNTFCRVVAEGSRAR